MLTLSRVLCQDQILFDWDTKQNLGTRQLNLHNLSSHYRGGGGGGGGELELELEFIAGGQSPWSWANQRAGEQAISLCPTPVQPPGARDTSRFEVSRTEVEPNYSMKLKITCRKARVKTRKTNPTNIEIHF